MTLHKILDKATDKTNFQSLEGYLDFCRFYLDYIQSNLQAVIVSQNENHYQFFQYDENGGFQITRPINSQLMLNADSFGKTTQIFLDVLGTLSEKKKGNVHSNQAAAINHVVYTLQQSIGAALDALPAGRSNTARKLNGDLFEQLIRLILQRLRLECRAGTVQVPVVIDGEAAFKMSYQHDLIMEKNGKIKMFGSVKTSSKDRIDKIFVDKFLYNKLTSTTVPHIAVFLHDVQRKNTKREDEYGINATFLPGHFKGYTVKLNPLDGVYYCDIRPNMRTEAILKEYIKTFDRLLVEDIWNFLKMNSETKHNT